MTRYRKLVAALVGAALVAVSQGLIVGTAAKVVAVAVAFLTAVGVHTVSNDDVGTKHIYDKSSDTWKAADTGASTVDICLVVITVLVVLWALGAVPK